MTKPIRLLLAALATAGLLSLSFAAAAGPHEGKGKPDKSHSQGKDKHAGKEGSGGKAGASAKGGVSVSISSGDARRIALNHRVTGYESLPPGIRKNLARGKPIPPGLAHRAVPAEVLVELPRYPDHEWRVYGTDLVLVALATAVVVDVLVDVFD